MPYLTSTLTLKHFCHTVYNNNNLYIFTKTVHGTTVASEFMKLVWRCKNTLSYIIRYVFWYNNLQYMAYCCTFLHFWYLQMNSGIWHDIALWTKITHMDDYSVWPNNLDLQCDMFTIKLKKLFSMWYSQGKVEQQNVLLSHSNTKSSLFPCCDSSQDSSCGMFIYIQNIHVLCSSLEKEGWGLSRSCGQGFLVLEKFSLAMTATILAVPFITSPMCDHLLTS